MKKHLSIFTVLFVPLCFILTGSLRGTISKSEAVNFLDVNKYQKKGE